MAPSKRKASEVKKNENEKIIRSQDKEKQKTELNKELKLGEKADESESDARLKVSENKEYPKSLRKQKRGSPIAKYFK